MSNLFDAGPEFCVARFCFQDHIDLFCVVSTQAVVIFGAVVN